MTSRTAASSLGIKNSPTKEIVVLGGCIPHGQADCCLAKATAQSRQGNGRSGGEHAPLEQGTSAYLFSSFFAQLVASPFLFVFIGLHQFVGL
jgi:hypothetical protein